MSDSELASEDLSATSEAMLWPRFLLFPTVAILGFVGFINGLGGDSLTVRSLWALGLGYCWFCVAGSFHEAVHQTMGRWKNANILFGRVVGTLLGIPYSAYRETHIRHHAYLNTAEDFELWPYSKPGTSLAFRRAFVVFEILAGVISAPIVYGRIYFARKSPLSPKARRTIRREYLGMFACWFSVGLTIATLSRLQLVELGRFDFMWLMPFYIAATFNSVRKFTEHLGLASTDPILGTRTVIGNNWVTRACSYFNFELFVHGPHHRFPKAAHFELESKLAEYRMKYPEADVPLFSNYLSAAWDALPCLWWNPAVGEVARQNDTSTTPIERPNVEGQRRQVA